jgi:pyruvate kinase
VRRTKIVATIGPASQDPETLARMVEAGLDVARLNFSHGNREIHAQNAERIHAAAESAGRQVAILQDLPGPKIRIGALQDDIAELKPGEKLVLVCGSEAIGNDQRMSVSWGGLADSVDPDDVVYLADGAIRLRVETVRPGDGEIETVVEIGGSVASRQGLNIPGATRGLPAVPEEDLDMLRFGESIGVDVVALSFVRTAEDVTSVRKHTRLPLIAKIEKPQAVDAAEEIIRSADCVMVARGDLGIELPIEDVP